MKVPIMLEGKRTGKAGVAGEEAGEEEGIEYTSSTFVEDPIPLGQSIVKWPFPPQTPHLISMLEGEESGLCDAASFFPVRIDKVSKAPD
jgi:hypothetical protein